MAAVGQDITFLDDEAFDTEASLDGSLHPAAMVSKEYTLLLLVVTS